MRCEYPGCNKKLTMVMKVTNRCKCQLTFCNKHRFPIDHLCSIDYKDVAKNKLRKDLIEIIPSKIQPI